MNIIDKFDKLESPKRAESRADTTVSKSELKTMLLELAAENEELKQAAGGSITDVMADWVAIQYLHAARQQVAATAHGPERFKLLRQICADTVSLQGGGHWSPRLKLDRERHALEQEKLKHVIAMDNQNPKKRRNVLAPLTDEERLAIIDKVDEVMGLK